MTEVMDGPLPIDDEQAHPEVGPSRNAGADSIDPRSYDRSALGSRGRSSGDLECPGRDSREGRHVQLELGAIVREDQGMGIGTQDLVAERIETDSLALADPVREEQPLTP